MAAGGITVPVYTTNTVSDHLYILSNSGAKAAIVSTNNLADRMIPAANQTDSISFVIIMEEMDINQASGFDIKTWQSVISMGNSVDGRMKDSVFTPAEDDTAVIIYTSGTGGAPKRRDAPAQGHSSQLQGREGRVEGVGT